MEKWRPVELLEPRILFSADGLDVTPAIQEMSQSLSVVLIDSSLAEAEHLAQAGGQVGLAGQLRPEHVGRRDPGPDCGHRFGFAAEDRLAESAFARLGRRIWLWRPVGRPGDPVGKRRPALAGDVRLPGRRGQPGLVRVQRRRRCRARGGVDQPGCCAERRGCLRQQ
jgi:hypothetical protein